MQNIRNFCIIAHIDHGKSTLADRLLELTETVEKREMKEQLLDTMELERERGITIKLQPVRMLYDAFILNLIDTPGHVDFSYEVSRSLAAVEGALLVVDATQGIQAQTLANTYQAQKQGLKIIPIVNKIDLPAAEPERVASEMINTFGFSPEEILYISAKTGENVEQVLEAIIEKIPPPSGNAKDPLRALIFDADYDPYRGVVAYVKIVDGEIKNNEEIFIMAAEKKAEAMEIGCFTPQMKKGEKLSAGEIGYIVTSLKDISLVPVGDTITLNKYKKEIYPLEGYQRIKPVVFAGFYPVDSNDYNKLKEGLSKLKLNDASLDFVGEKSSALGLGFRCGFLGMLHLDIVRERLEREFNLDLVVTSPTVNYELELSDGKILKTNNPLNFPSPDKIKKIKEPWVLAEILLPKEYLGKVMEMLGQYRGVFKETEYLGEDKVFIKYELPLSCLIKDFYDQLKSVSSGFASLNYEHIGMREGDLIKLDVILAGEKINSLSQIVVREEAQQKAKRIVKKLKEILPRQLFEVAIQAAVGGKILARENLPALKKDVTGYLYGGDRTRKDKLLKKQKAGKKKMKALGKVHVPSSVFLDLMKK